MRTRREDDVTLLPQDPRRLGSYECVRRLGEGAYGVVFEAKRGEERAAVKLLKHVDAGPAEQRRFRREVDALRTVDSPRVARYLHSGSSDHGLWVAVQYVEGQTLWKRVAPAHRDGSFWIDGWRRGARPLSGQELLKVLWDVLVGMRDLHGAGVTHRDLHPANVMVRNTWDKEEGPRAVLLDLGLSLHGDDRFTRTGEAIGHWQFTPPEQRGSSLGSWDPAADVYSWAATAVFASQGRSAHTLDQVLAAPREAPTPDLAEVPVDLADLLAGCLRGDPRERTSSDTVLSRLRELRSDWKDRDEAATTRARILSVDFTYPRDSGLGAGRVSPRLHIEPTYFRDETRLTVEVRDREKGWVAVADGDIARLRYVETFRHVVGEIEKSQEGASPPTLRCTACGTLLRAEHSRDDEGRVASTWLACGNRLTCPAQVCDRMKRLKVPTRMVSGGGGMMSYADEDGMALPATLFRLVWMGLMSSEADLFQVDLAAGRPGQDDHPENTGVDARRLELAEQRREKFRTGQPALVFVALTGAVPRRAVELVRGLGGVARAVEVGRQQLQDDEFRPRFPEGVDREQRRRQEDEWRAVHLTRDEAEALDHWRQPVLDAWEAAGVRF